MSSRTLSSQAWLRKQPDTTDSAVSAELEATTRAVIAAHDGHFQEAVQRVRWERHGVLQRLRRTHRPLAAA